MVQLVGAGFSHADVLGLTLSQAQAFAASAHRAERDRMALLLNLITAGARGTDTALRGLHRDLTKG